LVTHTSQGKLPASLVSLADARACRPNLLLMVMLVLIMFGLVWFLYLRCRDRHLHDALCATGERARSQCVERLFAVTHGAIQHGQIHTCDEFCVLSCNQFLCHISGCSPKNIGQHQQAFFMCVRQSLARLRERIFRLRLG